jgi:F0F1-type ATP synthase membrane subunit b/b'
MRRDLDLEVRIARAALRAQAAELATGVARRRIVETMTAADQERLMDRYLRQLDEPEART